MASTTFSGPVTSTNGFIGNVTGTATSATTATTATTAVSATSAIVTPQSTAAALGAIGNAINTTGKVVGKTVVDLATGKQYTATGTTAASTWVVSDGSTAITPA